MIDEALRQPIVGCYVSADGVEVAWRRDARALVPWRRMGQLVRLLERPDARVVVWRARYPLSILAQRGIKVLARLEDAYVAASVLGEAVDPAPPQRADLHAWHVLAAWKARCESIEAPGLPVAALYRAEVDTGLAAAQRASHVAYEAASTMFVRDLDIWALAEAVDAPKIYTDRTHRGAIAMRAIAYGLGPQSLMTSGLCASMGEAVEEVERQRDRWPEVGHWHDRIVRDWRESGGTLTATGRRVTAAHTTDSDLLVRRLASRVLHSTQRDLHLLSGAALFGPLTEQHGLQLLEAGERGVAVGGSAAAVDRAGSVFRTWARALLIPAQVGVRHGLDTVRRREGRSRRRG